MKLITLTEFLKNINAGKYNHPGKVLVIETRSNGDIHTWGPFDNNNLAVDWIEKQEKDLEDEGIDLHNWYLHGNKFEIKSE